MAAAALLAGAPACGGAKGPDAPVGMSTPQAPPQQAGPVEFEFDSLDARPTTAQALRGRPTVITFVTMGNLGSQAQVSFLSTMAAHDQGEVNYLLVALEKRDQRELVEIYREKLGVTFPVALADAATLVGTGPFGPIPYVPTTVVLDRRGEVHWRADGRVAKSDELRAQLRGL